jgi:hypothetical protein
MRLQLLVVVVVVKDRDVEVEDVVSYPFCLKDGWMDE